tara:strand:- start:171043 stop:172107 length:1065 start_codon:yes stop_codon:yes gene_type:complete
MAFKQLIQLGRDIGYNIIGNFNDSNSRKQALKLSISLFASITLILLIIMLWWDRSPSDFDPVKQSKQLAAEKHQKMVTGYVSTSTLIALGNSLLKKPGGYLSNDVMPPSIWMDNVPNFEFGVLVQIRDYARALRNDISRSQSQSLEDPDLAIAEPQFNFNSESWMFPPTENEYQKAITALESYLMRLSNTEQDDAQFYARADNLAAWLAIVEKRLGSLSQRLSASVGQVRINTDLAGDPDANQSTPAPGELNTQTPWTQIDDVFYETRGTAWALIHLLKAAEYDFSDILIKKNALISLRQIIRELEASQEAIWSPIILNGSGFGLMANHSLVMASYISRANAAIIDLRSLLSQG